MFKLLERAALTDVIHLPLRQRRSCSTPLAILVVAVVIVAAGIASVGPR
jgi:hypothetical protein